MTATTSTSHKKAATQLAALPASPKEPGLTRPNAQPSARLGSDAEPNARRSSHRPTRRTRKYVGLIISAALVTGGTVGFAIYKKMTYTNPIHPTSVVRYLGVYQPDSPGSYAGVAQFARSIGRQPNLVSYYSPWLDPFQASFATSVAKHGAITLVQIDPSNVSLASIVSSRYDTYLRSFAAAVKAFGGKVVLAFGHEMNGHWYSWGYRHTSAVVFVAAWRHIVNVFRSVGAENVIWLWTINVIGSQIPAPGPWWPGRSYVTWVGIDGYYFLPSSSFAQVFGPTIVAVRALTSDPILIAETGAMPASAQPAKINDLFAGVRAYGLFGFVWFDEFDKNKGLDWRINSPAALAALRQNAKAYMRPQARLAPAPARPSRASSSS
jgi:mannan endo-1,4-beta-mannosidase